MNDIAFIECSNGNFSAVDSEIFKALLSMQPWTMDSRGYARKSIKHSGNWRTHDLSHFVIEVKDGETADHKNGFVFDNRRSNLRVANRYQQSLNRGKIQRVCSSIYKGVKARRGGFCADIRINGVKKYLGDFKTQEEAAIAYNQAALKHHGEFARLNKIEGKD